MTTSAGILGRQEATQYIRCAKAHQACAVEGVSRGVWRGGKQQRMSPRKAHGRCVNGQCVAACAWLRRHGQREFEVDPLIERHMLLGGFERQSAV